MPRIVDHDLRRASIVRAMCAVIARDGIDGATMRRVAAEAQSTTGLVTHYFASKDELLIGALRHVQGAAGSRMISAISDRTGKDALMAAVEQALPLDDERRREWSVWLAFWGKAAADDRLRQEQESRYAEWKLLLDALIDDAGVPVPTDGLIALVDGIGTRATLEPDDFPAHQQLELVDNYVNHV